MITVAEALEALFALVKPVTAETVPLRAAAGRVLAETVTAQRDQPPFDGSAMDGYALRSDQAHPGARFRVVGESAAGHGYDGAAGPGEAIRIFTGAPLPAGTDRVVIQEDVARQGDTITLGDRLDTGTNVRPAGADFRRGDQMLAPRLLSPADLALLASMNVPQVRVGRRPEVALIATGDELVLPGESPAPDQIIASNTYALDALFRSLGARTRMLPIARDTRASLRSAFSLAQGADLVITIGGASVGDHDLVGAVAEELGVERSFYKVAMRPGKPLMAGRMSARMGGAMMIGLPGNPVSAIVCGHVFVAPVLRAMQGLPANPAPLYSARLSEPLAANGTREHYLRGRVTPDGIFAADRQDSSLLSVLSEANALILREPDAPAAAIGDIVRYIPI
ncbi:molybdopterin molybdenumtransferase MoeA [Pseudooceanicola sediminis]|uniref:Molybdopterin molybdenumtransferase n=1 Tax=Pseudooceanicola sediminis TaxID=2211117 RepID=A0A399J528_9RHOB|nr:gephyrin-like molybdotransferase Glp [Pseudooceanicola sediminis]KAA2317333.1 molybdopterin molybdotransferase MoeA [Puniceibacterium sp. HSS470]RII39687.1 molybdopterin molybdenumtransferase MoeA [Pseudooceanicola sediminis]|tara:strand:+ start:9902 stop:11086 length:1185 start_codon:yes stop_codon:yes gene_type:complete